MISGDQEKLELVAQQLLSIEQAKQEYLRAVEAFKKNISKLEEEIKKMENQ